MGRQKKQGAGEPVSLESLYKQTLLLNRLRDHLTASRSLTMFRVYESACTCVIPVDPESGSFSG